MTGPTPNLSHVELLSKIIATHIPFTIFENHCLHAIVSELANELSRKNTNDKYHP